MQSQIEEFTLAKEFWPWRRASWWWLPQVPAASEVSGQGLYAKPSILVAWLSGGLLFLTGPSPGQTGNISFQINLDQQNFAAF